MCLYAGNDVLVAEFVYNIQDVKLLGAAGLGGLVDACQAGVDDGSGTTRLPDQYVFHGTPH